MYTCINEEHEEKFGLNFLGLLLLKQIECNRVWYWYDVYTFMNHCERLTPIWNMS